MMQYNEKEFLWTEKYRPKKLAEVILPKDIKAHFEQFIAKGTIPNLLLSGGAGIGKTTVAKAMLEEIGADYIFINASLNRGIDVLRNDIACFASTVSFGGGRKYVLLDEADNLTVDMQKALRGFIEAFAANCGFILTCNYENKLLPALLSRDSVINFAIAKKEAPKLALQFFKRVCEILKAEGVTYDEKSVAAIIQRYFPDWRRGLNELQRYSAGGTIDSGILSVRGHSIDTLVPLIKEKNYTQIRHWVKENSDTDTALLMRSFYDASLESVKPEFIPLLVITIAKYQYQAAFAADQEVNLMAFLAEVMLEVEFNG